MQPIQPQDPQERAQTYAKNHEMLLGLFYKGAHRSASDADRSVRMRLERFLVDRSTQSLVPFEGQVGIEAMLNQLASQWPGCTLQHYDGHLMGIAVRLLVRGNVVPVIISLGAGGQIVCSVGPTDSVVTLRESIDDFDRQMHLASLALGCDYVLVAEGYNPYTNSPLDVQLIPRARFTLLSAYLAQTGRYARDALRCTCATQVLLRMGNDRESLDAFQLATALYPILSFLTDNVRSFRGSGARRCPRMVRSIIWDEVDPARCGLVPDTFERGFTFERYLTWAESLQPILLTDDSGTVTSTGKRSMADVMGDSALSAREGRWLLEAVHPPVRLGANVELLQADALLPAQAAAYAAFVKGLLGTPLSLDQTRDLLGPISEADVREATESLRKNGWDAQVFGRPVADIVNGLLHIARTCLTDAEERELLEQVAPLWDFHMVPRDAFVQQETKASRGW